ncbi:MAG TPA: hypothetical protein ENN73_05680 [Firmicutes bacterium]|nr:hypothetical protein [Bacillota bacterium]
MKKIIILFLLCFFSFTVFSSEAESDINKADEYFSQGKIHEAEEIYNKLCQSSPTNYAAQLGHSRCALLMNHLGCAFRYGKNASDLKPSETEPRENMAVAYYRLGRFDKASEIYSGLGRKVLIKKLNSFKGLEPYKIDSDEVRTTIKLETAEPFPVIKVSVNGDYEGLFILDTGTPETVLDKNFAKRVKADTFGKEKGTIFGKDNISFEHGKIDTIRIGGMTVSNIPVYTADFSKLFRETSGSMKIEGILGYGFLSNFILYASPLSGEISLRTVSTEDEYKSFSEEIDPADYFTVPFFLTRGNEMVTGTRLNGELCVFFKVDLGQPGIGISVEKNAVQESQIEYDLTETTSQKVPVNISEGIAESLEFGEIKLNRIKVRITDLGSIVNKYPFPINGVIGWEYFKSNETIFDFIGMRILVKKPNTDE